MLKEMQVASCVLHPATVTTALSCACFLCPTQLSSAYKCHLIALAITWLCSSFSFSQMPSSSAESVLDGGADSSIQLSSALCLRTSGPLGRFYKGSYTPHLSLIRMVVVCCALLCMMWSIHKIR